MSHFPPAIIEAAARALRITEIFAAPRTYIDVAEIAVNAALPLIEAAALEKAAKVAEDYDGEFEEVILAQGDIAAAIRDLIAKDSGGGD